MIVKEFGGFGFYRGGRERKRRGEGEDEEREKERW
jgi:hypothetical protein